MPTQADAVQTGTPVRVGGTGRHYLSLRVLLSLLLLVICGCVNREAEVTQPSCPFSKLPTLRFREIE